MGNLPKNDEAFNSMAFDKAKDGVVVTWPLEDVRDLFRCADGLVFAR